MSKLLFTFLLILTFFSVPISAQAAPVTCSGDMKNGNIIKDISFSPSITYVGKDVEVKIVYDSTRVPVNDYFRITLVDNGPSETFQVTSNNQPFVSKFDGRLLSSPADYKIKVEALDSARQKILSGDCQTQDKILEIKALPPAVEGAKCSLALSYDNGRYKLGANNISGVFSTISFDPRTYNTTQYSLVLFPDPLGVIENRAKTGDLENAIYYTSSGPRFFFKDPKDRSLDPPARALAYWSVNNSYQSYNIPNTIATNINTLAFGLQKYTLLGLAYGSPSTPRPGYTGQADLKLCAFTSFEMDMVDHTPTPLPPPPALTAEIQPNREIKINWSNVTPATDRDWIGMYLSTTPHTSYTNWQDWLYTNCTKTSGGTPKNIGSCFFPPPQPGFSYIFFLFSNDRYDLMATSNSIFIPPPPTAPPGEPTYTPIPTSTPIPTPGPTAALTPRPTSRASGIACDPDSGAETAGQGVMTAIGCVPTEPTKLVQGLLRFSTAMSGGIALLLMAYGAFQMITSAGNPEGVKKGQEQLTNAIIGLLIIIFSVLLLQIIGVDILQIPGF